jgi:extracellular elastinolytic metalloproteinase
MQFRRNHSPLVLLALAVGCDPAGIITSDHPTGVHAPGPGEAALTAPSGDEPRAVAGDFLRHIRPDRVVDSAVVVVERQAAGNGRTYIRMEQVVDGLRVVGAYSRAAVDEQGRLLHLIDNLAAIPEEPLVIAGRDEAALAAALTLLGLSSTDPMVEAPQVERVAYPDADGVLRPGYLVETWAAKGNLLHHTIVDEAGRVVSSELRTNTDSYNVFAEDPGKGAQAVVEGPAPGGVESPAGWLGGGGQNSIHITGNNANAYLDAMDNNRPDRGGVAVSSGNFLTSADLTQSPTAAGNREVAVQNLFFHNNRIHDILYRHGFDEAAGNFQDDNFGRGGAGGDPVNAEAQDGGGTDNANFATPSDGRSGRMQMYLWTGAGPTHQVVINAPTAGAYDASGATFGPALDATGLTGDVVVVDDGVGTGTDGCEALAGLSGKIALIDRGTCAFVDKALHAQSAGAIGVIVANNQGGTTRITMGGDSKRVRIPAVMVSQNDGAAIKAMSGVNATERAHPSPPLQVDASLDSDVIYHEYGHGLSWRMIGGMSGPLSGAIGEGNSDGVSMLVNGDDVVGEYSSSNPNGIRSAPYANFPRSYASVTGTEVHFDGEVYGAIIWRLIELFGAAGVESDVLFDIVIDGMNFTPASPAFEDMRDGMVQSANAAGGANTCLVWRAFADYGVGVGADGVVNADGTVTATESFDVPAECQ